MRDISKCISKFHIRMTVNESTNYWLHDNFIGSATLLLHGLGEKDGKFEIIAIESNNPYDDGIWRFPNNTINMEDHVTTEIRMNFDISKAFIMGAADLSDRAASRRKYPKI